MKVMFDINVVLDIAAKREPFFSASPERISSPRISASSALALIAAW